MALQDEVGRAIRRRREHRGLSQADLAEAIGRSLQSVGKIERGRSAPTFETLEAIGRVLATPVRDFFPAANPSEDETTGRIAMLLAPLTPAERAWVEGVVVAMLHPGWTLAAERPPREGQGEVLAGGVHEDGAEE